MPSVEITQQLYEYLKNNLVNESIDATIRTLINKDDLRVDQFGVDDGMDTAPSSVAQDDTSVGSRGDSTNSGYIR